MTIESKYFDSREINLDNPGIARRRGDDDEEGAPTPEEGVRLIKAFHRIKNAALRDDIVTWVEKLSQNDN
jgi:hypothetical protein